MLDCISNLDIIEPIVNTFFSEPVEYHIVDVCVMLWHLLISQYTFHVCRDLLFSSVIASGSNKIGKSKRKRQLVCFWFQVFRFYWNRKRRISIFCCNVNIGGMPPYGNHGGIIRKSVLSAVIVQMYLIIIKGVSISISSEATYIC